VIITTYNQHVRLLPPEPWLLGRYQVYSTRGSRHCYEIKWFSWPACHGSDQVGPADFPQRDFGPTGIGCRERRLATW